MDELHKFAILFRLLLSPLAAMGVSLLTAAIFRARALHSNARLLLIAMTLYTLVCNIGVLVETMYKFFISYVLPEDTRCEYQVFRPQYFLGIRNLYVVGGLGLVFSTCTLAIERVVATVRYRTYEKKIDYPVLGLLLVLVEFLCCVVPTLMMKLPKQMYPYAPPEVYDADGTHRFSLVIIGMNMLALVTFLVLWRVNKHRSKILVDEQLRVLSTRYQLRENISTTRLMVPIMAIVALMTASSEIVYLIALPNYQADTVVTTNVLRELIEYAPFAEYQLSLFPVLTIAMVVCLPIFSTHVKKAFLSVSHLSLCIPDNFAVTDAMTADEAREIYFARLNGQWKDKRNESVVARVANYQT